MSIIYQLRTNRSHLGKLHVSVTLSLTLLLLSGKNSYFGKHLFYKTRTGYAYKTLSTILCDRKNFSLLRALNKDFYFISEELFYKATENFFPVFA